MEKELQPELQTNTILNPDFHMGEGLQKTNKETKQEEVNWKKKDRR